MGLQAADPIFTIPPKKQKFFFARWCTPVLFADLVTQLVNINYGYIYHKPTVIRVIIKRYQTKAQKNLKFALVS